MVRTKARPELVGRPVRPGGELDELHFLWRRPGRPGLIEEVSQVPTKLDFPDPHSP